MNNPVFSIAHGLTTSIRRRQVSATEVLDAHLTHLARYNPQLNAIVALDEGRAPARTKEADMALARGEVWEPLQPEWVLLAEAR